MSNGPELTRRLADLLREPRETLEVELKNWLDIQGDRNHKASLAKELIALANHGGGHLILGFAETNDGVVPAEPRPDNLTIYSPDAINSAISRFAEPAFHCDVRIVESPITGHVHPIISVPGGHTVPIRSKRVSPDGQSIQANYYIRRPGPASEPPQTAQEWDALIRRCVANAREELVDRFRIIMAGGFGSGASETALDRVTAWFDVSLERWRELSEKLARGHGARLEFGHYAVAYHLLGDFEPPRGVELLESLRKGCVRHTGWPPFWVPTPDGISPYIYDGNVECWLGRDAGDRDPATSDYWRASPQAQFFLMRGFQEDSSESRGIEPGRYFELTTTTWRIGEILLHAASMARQFRAPDAQVVFLAEWSGLENRSIATYANPRRAVFQTYTSRQNTFRASLEVQADQIENSLPELVDGVVRPLYELFDFFQLPPTLVAEELATLRSNRF